MRLNGIENKNKNKNQSIESNVSSKHRKRFENIDCCSCLLALTQSPKVNLQMNDFGIHRKIIRQTIYQTSKNKQRSHEYENT